MEGFDQSPVHHQYAISPVLRSVVKARQKFSPLTNDRLREDHDVRTSKEVRW